MFSLQSNLPADLAMAAAVSGLNRNLVDQSPYLEVVVSPEPLSRTCYIRSQQNQLGI